MFDALILIACWSLVIGAFPFLTGSIRFSTALLLAAMFLGVFATAYHFKFPDALIESSRFGGAFAVLGILAFGFPFAAWLCGKLRITTGLLIASLVFAVGASLIANVLPFRWVSGLSSTAGFIAFGIVVIWQLLLLLILSSASNRRAKTLGYG